MDSKLLKPVPPHEVSRLASGGVWVNIKRDNVTATHVASGANLSRVLQRIGSNVDFMLITCFRPHDEVTDTQGLSQKVPRSMDKNQSLFYGMPKELRSLVGTDKVGGYWMIGHWTNCVIDGEEQENFPLNQCAESGGEVQDNLEYSWLFTRDDASITPDAWLQAGCDLSVKYDQQAFIVRLAGETTLRSQKGAVWDSLSSEGTIDEAWKNLAKLRATKPFYGYTELKRLRSKGRRQPLVLAPKETEEKAETGTVELPKAAGKRKTSAYHVAGSGRECEIDFFMAKPEGNSSRMFFAAIGAKAGIEKDHNGGE
jgi:hypothetical protein